MDNYTKTQENCTEEILMELLNRVGELERIIEEMEAKEFKTQQERSLLED